jgi:transposase-like protein
MPWDARDTMSLRSEFVLFASQDGANLRALCRHFNISPSTGYKWLRRWTQEGAAGLADRSRAPLHSPRRTDDRVTDLLRMATAPMNAGAPVRLSAGLRTADTFCPRSAPCTT